MIEQCYVMVKPGFTKPEVIQKTINTIISKDFKLVDSSYIYYITILSYFKVYNYIFICKKIGALHSN